MTKFVIQHGRFYLRNAHTRSGGRTWCEDPTYAFRLDSREQAEALARTQIRDELEFTIVEAKEFVIQHRGGKFLAELVASKGARVPYFSGNLEEALKFSEGLYAISVMKSYLRDVTLGLDPEDLRVVEV